MLPFLGSGSVPGDKALHPRKLESSVYLTVTLEISFTFSVHLSVPYQWKIHFDCGL